VKSFGDNNNHEK